MRTGNPALNDNAFRGFAVAGGAEAMTIQGTVNKTLILLFLLFTSANWAWARAAESPSFIMIGLIGGLITAIVTVFKKQWVPITAPIYALFEGMALGGISALMNMQYPGIVIQAVALTFGVLFSLLLAYKTGLIKATENFKLGVVAATGGIFVVYMLSLVLSLFGVRLSMIHGSGLFGILFSLFVVVIAAMNLVLDFDFIEHASESGAPKFMEWYGAFGLMVTLIWLYIEILRLLAKLQSRR